MEISHVLTLSTEVEASLKGRGSVSVPTVFAGGKSVETDTERFIELILLGIFCAGDFFTHFGHCWFHKLIFLLPPTNRSSFCSPTDSKLRRGDSLEFMEIAEFFRSKLTCLCNFANLHTKRSEFHRTSHWAYSVKGSLDEYPVI